MDIEDGQMLAGEARIGAVLIDGGRAHGERWRELGNRFFHLLDRIVITTYQPSARWRPRTISPALGLLALMDNTVAAQQAPEKTMPVLRRAVERAQLIRSRRGGAGAVADALLGATG